MLLLVDLLLTPGNLVDRSSVKDLACRNLDVDGFPMAEQCQAARSRKVQLRLGLAVYHDVESVVFAEPPGLDAFVQHQGAAAGPIRQSPGTPTPYDMMSEPLRRFSLPACITP
jgi:hypothetical protein